MASAYFTYLKSYTIEVAVIRKELLDILVCPMGKAELKLEGDWLVCTRCGPRFRIEDDIPIMLIDEAELPEGVPSIEQLPCMNTPH
jgi:uncharacterized protein YbaR (Trm112 family)